MGERATSKVLGHQIGAAFIFDRDKLDDKWMVQFSADFLFALKALKAGWVTLDLEQRHFDRHGLARLPVIGFEQGSHAAFGNDVGDFKAAVQQCADADFLAGLLVERYAQLEKA